MRVIAEDLWFPEGPVWLGDGSLLVVEIRRKTLTRVWLDGRKRIVAELGGGPNGAAIGPDGHAYVCNNGGFKFVERADGRWVTAGTPDDYVTGRIERVNLATGAVERVCDRVGIGAGEQPVRGPNDIVFDAHGGFYFTDPGKTRHRDWDRGSVCYAKADGSQVAAGPPQGDLLPRGGADAAGRRRTASELVFPIHKPNGIGLSPDGKTLYVAETETARLWAWDIEAPGRFKRPAVASPESPHGSRLVYASPVYQRFDSLAVEGNGNVCIATLDRGGITVVNPLSGSAEFVPVPGGDTHVTNLCFGGADLRKVYVTLSHSGRLVEMDWPRAGLPDSNSPVLESA
jgi:gluconolactonase